MQSRSRALIESLLLILFCSALQADITLTKLANEGVIISAGETRIMIDGMVVEPYSVYGGLPADAEAQFREARGEFAGIDLALVSHRHHEHNQPEFACAFLQTSPATELYTSAQVIGLIREKCRSFISGNPRVHTIDPQYGAPHLIEISDARVTAFPLSHGTRKRARIQNFGHLVEIDGMKVLHIGDAAMQVDEFERAGLRQVKLDIALIPFLYFQPGPGAAIVDRYLNARLKIAMHIPPSEMEEVKTYMAKTYPRVLILERPLDQVRFSANPSSNP